MRRQNIKKSKKKEKLLKGKRRDIKREKGMREREQSTFICEKE